MLTSASTLATYAQEALLTRNRLYTAFFSRESQRLALASRDMSDRFLAGGDRAIPAIQGKIGAAEQIVGRSVVGRGVDAAAQGADRVVDASGGEQIKRSVGAQGEGRQQRKR